MDGWMDACWRSCFEIGGGWDWNPAYFCAGRAGQIGCGRFPGHSIGGEQACGRPLEGGGELPLQNILLTWNFAQLNLSPQSLLLRPVLLHHTVIMRNTSFRLRLRTASREMRMPNPFLSMLCCVASSYTGLLPASLVWRRLAIMRLEEFSVHFA